MLSCALMQSAATFTCPSGSVSSFALVQDAFEQLMCLLPVDESRTSTEAAAALGLQNTSRLKQQVCILFSESSLRVMYTGAGCRVCLLSQNQGLTAVMLAQGKLDAVAAALLLTAYYERPEAAVKVKSIRHSQ